MARELAKSPDDFEARGVEPVFLSKIWQSIMPRADEIRILDSSGEVERIIAFNEADRNRDAIHPDKYMASSSRSLSRNRTAFSAL